MMLGFGPHDHETGGRQDFEMMRDRRLREREALRHLAARQLPRSRELLNHSETMGVSECLEDEDEIAVLNRFFSHR